MQKKIQLLMKMVNIFKLLLKQEKKPDNYKLNLKQVKLPLKNILPNKQLNLPLLQLKILFNKKFRLMMVTKKLLRRSKPRWPHYKEEWTKELLLLIREVLRWPKK
jgi:hypothetical protein